MAENNGRFTQAEVDWIKSVFGGDDENGNVFALTTLRKIFVPFYDVDAPLGQTVNLYATIDPTQSPELIAREVFAINKFKNTLENQLNHLKIIAGVKKVSAGEIALKKAKDSMK